MLNDLPSQNASRPGPCTKLCLENKLLFAGFTARSSLVAWNITQTASHKIFSVTIFAEDVAEDFILPSMTVYLCLFMLIHHLYEILCLYEVQLYVLLGNN